MVDKNRVRGIRSRERMTERPEAASANSSPPISERPAHGDLGEATVVAAVPLLRTASERDAARAMEAGCLTILRILSEANLAEDSLEWFDDNVKPFVEGALWSLRKVTRGV